MTVGEVKNSKFNFQRNRITTLIFGNQFCSFQELLWLHFIVIVIIIIANQSIKGQSQYHNYYYDYYISKRSLAGQAFIIITTIFAYAYKFALQTKHS